ncbi:MAG: hypothetical protein IKN38_02240 [Clostridia bacterium]|nr:hypothetical protein [Clostridia bacterium]
MKKLTKILALALMMALVVTVFAACGDKKEGAETADNAGEAASAKGETQTWGNITIFVPDDYKLTGGDMFDAENPDKLTLNTKSDSSFEYVMVSANFTEDNAVMSLDTTRELNEGCEDVEITAGANKWTGVAYNSLGVDCVALYAQIGEGYVVLNSSGMGKDNASLKAILESIVVK